MFNQSHFGNKRLTCQYPRLVPFSGRYRPLTHGLYKVDITFKDNLEVLFSKQHILALIGAVVISFLHYLAFSAHVYRNEKQYVS